MQLDQLQQQFIKNLTNTHNNSESFLLQLNEGSLTTETQLGIYRRNYTGSLQKVLQQIYPACYRILGPDYFHTLCRDYYLLHPSTDADLNIYGEHFNRLLQSQTESNERLNGYEYLYDLATLEWNWHKSYYAQNDSTFDFEQFSLLSADQHSEVIFTLSHPLSLQSSVYPVLDIWNDNLNEEATNSDYELPDKPINFCIFRHKFTSHCEVLDTNISQAIIAIKNKMDLDSLCHYDDIDITNTLPQLIQKGWVTGFTLKDEQC